MKNVFLLLLSLGLPHLVIAQSAGIQGHIIAYDTRKPLPDANVVIEGTTLGTTTNAEGEYTITGLRDTAYVVKASHVGYKTQRFRTVPGNGGLVQIDFTLMLSEILGEPITVTATHGKERETPATFSTLDRAQVRERYTTQDIPVLLQELPSTTTYSDAGNGIGYTYMNIRGFDARRIAVMVNGIPQNDPEDHNVYWLDFPDIASSVEDIQVERGAGSAFYGPPAIGGSVNLVTNNFGRERSFQLSAGVGDYNTRRYAASFSSGLIDNQYAVHARLSKILSDGYRDRSWVNFNSYFLGLIRYDENMTTQVNFYGGPLADHLAYYGIPKEDITDPEKRKANPILRNEELENFSQPHYEFFNEWRLNPSLTLNNTLFLVLGDGFFDYDGSWAPYSYYRVTQQNGFNVTGDPDTLYFPNALIRATVSNKQWGWLPRLTVKQDDGEFIAGAELRFHRSEHWGNLQRADELPVAIPEDYRYYYFRGAKDIVSLYAQELHRFQPDLTALVSVQYAYNRYRLYDEKYIGTDFAVPYHFINPRLGVNYNFDERWNGYLSLAYTSREPRLTNLYNAGEASTPVSWGEVVPLFARRADGSFDFSSPLVKPEKLFDMECGARYSGEAGKISANVYWMEFTDEIVDEGAVDRFGQPLTENAPRTRHVGVEISGTVNLSHGFQFAGNLTLSSNRLVEHSDSSTGVPVSLKGNAIAHAPDILANGRLSYTLDNLNISWGGRFVGKQYADNLNTESQAVDPFFVSDASISYKIDGLVSNVGVEAKIQVNNLFNKLYAAYGNKADATTFQYFVGAERNAFFNLAVNL